VIVNQDFTGENRTDDVYGHGSHVASIAAGSGVLSNGAYTGIAPAASLVNLRVLDSQGLGSTSSLLAALQLEVRRLAMDEPRHPDSQLRVARLMLCLVGIPVCQGRE